MILALEAASVQVQEQERGVRCGLYIRYAWPRKFYILDDLHWSSVWRVRMIAWRDTASARRRAIQYDDLMRAR